MSSPQIERSISRAIGRSRLLLARRRRSFRPGSAAQHARLQYLLVSFLTALSHPGRAHSLVADTLSCPPNNLPECSRRATSGAVLAIIELPPDGVSSTTHCVINDTSTPTVQKLCKLGTNACKGPLKGPLGELRTRRPGSDAGDRPWPQQPSPQSDAGCELRHGIADGSKPSVCRARGS